MELTCKLVKNEQNSFHFIKGKYKLNPDVRSHHSTDPDKYVGH